MNKSQYVTATIARTGPLSVGIYFSKLAVELFGTNEIVIVEKDCKLSVFKPTLDSVHISKIPNNGNTSFKTLNGFDLIGKYEINNDENEDEFVLIKKEN